MGKEGWCLEELYRGVVTWRIGIKRPISGRRNFRWQGLEISESRALLVLGGAQVVGVAEMRAR